MSYIRHRYNVKRVVLLVLIPLLLLTIIATVFYFRQRSFDGRGRAADPEYSPATATVKNYTDEIGPILRHGATFKEIWSRFSNNPPTDGSIKTWSYYPNGNEIVTKGNTFWLKQSPQQTWVIGELKQKWSSCLNFPPDGIDAYSIHPGTGEEYAFKGITLFILLPNGQCKTDGKNMRSEWNATALSPTGNHPLKYNDFIDQFQWLNNDSQVYFTKSQIWLIGANPSALQCETPGTTWKFCEPEELERRWVVRAKFINHPPTDKVGTMTVNYPGNFQFYTYGDTVWTLGQNGVTNTFRKGFDGFGARDPFILKDNGKYYMYYDASDANQNWRTAIAVADNPKGPWTKGGFVGFTGTERWWEKGCHCASTVYKVDLPNIGTKYVNFYLGAQGYFNAGTQPADTIRIPGWNTNQNPDGSTSYYYYLGLAIADTPFGPFKRLKGDGTLNEATVNDPPVLRQTSSGWHKGSTGSAMGTLINDNEQYYYSFVSVPLFATIPFGKTGYGTNSYGIGIARAQNNNVLGPWIENETPLIPPSEVVENAGIVFEPNSKTYFMFANAIEIRPNDAYNGLPNPKWSSTGQSLVMYWTKDLLNWDTNNYRVVASMEKGFVNSDFNKQTKHRGRVGLGFPVLVPEENKIYVAFDGNDFTSNTLDHMYRNIYLLSVDIPATQTVTPTPQPTQTPIPTLTTIPTVTSTPVVTSTPSPIPSQQPTVTTLPTSTTTPVPSPTQRPVTPTVTNTPLPTISQTPIPTIISTPQPTALPTTTSQPTSTTTPVVCDNSQGDANCDGVITLLDFAVFRQEYVSDVQSLRADFNKDGKVDLIDFVIFKLGYNAQVD